MVWSELPEESERFGVLSSGEISCKLSLTGELNCRWCCSLMMGWTAGVSTGSKLLLPEVREGCSGDWRTGGLLFLSSTAMILPFAPAVRDPIVCKCIYRLLVGTILYTVIIRGGVPFDTGATFSFAPLDFFAFLLPVAERSSVSTTNPNY